MPTPYESARLNLQLFELRREPVLREARQWFLLDFNPESLADMQTLAGGDRNTSFRMVISYWETATSLVTFGAIDAEAFLAAHGELVATFGKLQPFLAPLRSLFHEPGFCKHIEAVVMTLPDAETLMRRRCETIRAAAKARAAAANAT